jgi:hypothetical protein
MHTRLPRPVATQVVPTMLYTKARAKSLDCRLWSWRACVARRTCSSARERDESRRVLADWRSGRAEMWERTLLLFVSARNRDIIRG